MMCREKPDIVKDRETERALQRIATRCLYLFLCGFVLTFSETSFIPDSRVYFSVQRGGAAVQCCEETPENSR